MALFKCKMCGGDLELAAGMTVAECEYCGTKQTVPTADNEKKITLFTRANRLRAACEFDKAAGIYESIVADFPEEAEAYWGLILCQYGIEYVDDPASGNKVPTCHRSSFESLMDDPNFEQVMEYSDPMSRRVYRDEAKAIEEIRKRIIEVSGKEEPYDIFICYKETDFDGNRTLDSVLAQDVYDALTDRGYRVFFSRITLEDKLGVEYEPYIFAALNSAKVMLAVGTDYEYYNAVWVKNEWSRFLKLIAAGQKKVLIPCFKGIDAYDMPKEFARLQSQDLGKVGAIQDLLRGIDKILGGGSKKVETVIVQQGAANFGGILKRGNLALEDGEWTKADGFFEEVLNQDAECAEAYLGKLMAELHVSEQDSLKDQAEPFDNHNNYKKAIRFSDDKLKSILIGYIEHINTRNELARLEGIFSRAKNLMSFAKTESVYKEAAQMFEAINDYKDSAELAKECYKKAEEASEAARKDAILTAGKHKMGSINIATLEEAIKQFESISGWKDANECADTCRNIIEEINARLEAERLERERLAEITRKKAEMRTKRNKKIAIITTPIVCAIIAFIIILNTVIIPNGKYNNAIALMNSGKYEEAVTIFEELDGYKESETHIQTCILDSKYNDAVALMEAGKYANAISAFKALDGYKDSYAKISECNKAILDGKYNDAVALVEAGNVIEAYKAFIALDGYKDSTEKANSIYDEYKSKILKNAKVGDYVFFGTYEQDNNTSNGKENIEWLVLEVKDGKALVISKYALDCKQYDTWQNTWKYCHLRKWLNDDFINAAFSADEKSAIPTITVSADKNPKYKTDPGKPSQDQVFLLSITEANKYFSSDSARQCEATDYAVASGAYVNSSNGNCWWWLRTPGEGTWLAACVNTSGGVRDSGKNATELLNAVRPAMWIDLNA